MTISSPTTIPSSPSARDGRTSSHASGAPSRPCRGASERVLRVEWMTPIFRRSGCVLSAARRFVTIPPGCRSYCVRVLSHLPRFVRHSFMTESDHRPMERWRPRRVRGFAQPALVNGVPGLVLAPRGRLFRAVSFSIARGKIGGIEVIADPARLHQLELAVLDE